MGAESENAQEPEELRKIAADDLFQAGHPAMTPGIEVLRRQQVHADEDIKGGDNPAVLQDRRHDASDAWLERVFTMSANGNHRFPGPSCPDGQARLVALLVFHGFIIQICMVAADEVFGVSKIANSCGLTRPLLEEHQGIVYRLLDFYCMNPSCKCGETHLSVIRADKDAAASDKPWITIRLHFEGKVGLSNVTGPLARQQAAALITKWIQKDPALPVDIEARYRRIKDIGKRILGRKVK